MTIFSNQELSACTNLLRSVWIVLKSEGKFVFRNQRVLFVRIPRYGIDVSFQVYGYCDWMFFFVAGLTEKPKIKSLEELTLETLLNLSSICNMCWIEVSTSVSVNMMSD